jgi:hypothetical protein
MRIDFSTLLDCSVEQAVAQVMTTRLLQFVAHPLVHFTPIKPSSWPVEWSEGTYWVAVRLLGILPFGKQAIVISFPQSGGGFLLRDSGHSALVKVWEHTISITSNAGRTRYKDSVVIDAGLLTLPIWLLAQAFYRHRQRRWRLLARRLSMGEVFPP